VDFDRLNPHADPQNRKASSVLKNFPIRLLEIFSAQS